MNIYKSIHSDRTICVFPSQDGGISMSVRIADPEATPVVTSISPADARSLAQDLQTAAGPAPAYTHRDGAVQINGSTHATFASREDAEQYVALMNGES